MSSSSRAAASAALRYPVPVMTARHEEEEEEELSPDDTERESAEDKARVANRLDRDGTRFDARARVARPCIELLGRKDRPHKRKGAIQRIDFLLAFLLEDCLTELVADMIVTEANCFSTIEYYLHDIGNYFESSLLSRLTKKIKNLMTQK